MLRNHTIAGYSSCLTDFVSSKGFHCCLHDTNQFSLKDYGVFPKWLFYVAVEKTPAPVPPFIFKASVNIDTYIWVWKFVKVRTTCSDSKSPFMVWQPSGSGAILYRQSERLNRGGAKELRQLQSYIYLLFDLLFLKNKRK